MPSEGRPRAPVANDPISIEPDAAFKPLSIADIADRGVALTVQRWRTLSVLILLEAVPVSLMRAILPARGPAYWASYVVDILLVALLYPAAILTATAPAKPSPGPVLQAAARRYGSSLATFLISAAWTILWMLIAAVAGVLAMVPFAAAQSRTAMVVSAAVAAAAAALVILPRAGLVASTMLPIVILERCSAWEALKRARRRVNHAGFLRSSLLGLALFAVTVAPILVVSSAFDAIVDATHLASLRAVDELISDAVSVGLGSVLSTIAALDLRARCEGTDLEAGLDAAAT